MKKIRSICAIAILTLAFVLSGCGKQKEEGAVKSGDDEYIYVPEYQVLGGSGIQVSSAVIGNDQSVFYLESDGAEVKIVSLDMESHETTDLLVELAENKEIASLNSDGEGNLLYSVIGCSDMETGQLEEVVIKKMAPDGRELFSLDVSEIFLQQPDFYYITAVLMVKKKSL